MRYLFLSITLLILASACTPPSYGSPTATASAATAPVQGTVGPVTPLPTSRAVTLADDGKTLQFKVGENFLLNLGADYEWTVQVHNTTVVSRLVNVAVVKGAQGVYMVNAAGQATIEANGEPACKTDQPPCDTPSKDFSVTIVAQ